MEPNSLGMPETAKNVSVDVGPGVFGTGSSCPRASRLWRTLHSVSVVLFTFVRHTQLTGSKGDAGSGQRLQPSKTGSEAAPRLVSSDEHSDSTEHLKDAEAKDERRRPGLSPATRDGQYGDAVHEGETAPGPPSRAGALGWNALRRRHLYESHERPIFGMLLAL